MSSFAQVLDLLGWVQGAVSVGRLRDRVGPVWVCLLPRVVSVCSPDNVQQAGGVAG